jgi:hypothetical protein
VLTITGIGAHDQRNTLACCAGWAASPWTAGPRLRFDYPRRLILTGPLFQPTGDYEGDLAAMRSYVDARMALRPENYA